MGQTQDGRAGRDVLLRNILQQNLTEEARLQTERSERGVRTILILSRILKECGMIRRHLEGVNCNGKEGRNA